VNVLAEPVATAARVVSLGEAVELNPRADRGQLSDDLEVSFVPMAAVEAATGRMDASTVRRFGEVKRGYTIFRERDVLFAKITPCMENGKMAVARGLRNGVGCGSTEFHVLRPRPGVDPHYVYHFVSSGQFRARAAHHMTGAVGQKRVPVAYLEQCEIPLPDLEEQRRIAAEIEKQFSRLDEAVASLERLQGSLARYRASVLFAAAGSPQTDWPQRRIADLLSESIVNGLSVKESPIPTAVRALRLSAMSDSGLDYSDHRYLPVDWRTVEDIVVRGGDFFVSRGNGSLALVGRGTIAQNPPLPVIFPDTMMRLRFSDPAVLRWVAMLWPSRLVRRQIEQRVKTTAGIYKMSQPQVASITVPLPPPLERERIIAEVDRRLSIVREVEAEVVANLKRAQALRQAILSKAFAGCGERGE